MKHGDPVIEERCGELRLAALNGLIGYQIKRTHARVQADFRETTAPFGLTHRTFSVLSLVHENPGISQSQISRELGIERSGTAVIVGHLGGRNLVTRSTLEWDRRTHALKTTPKGAELYNQAHNSVKAHEARILTALNSGEIEILHSLLQRVGA